VFTDRVEVWNPGKLPSQLTVDKLKQPHNSCPTNPLLAEVLFWSSYVQKAGSGTLEMVKQCRENGLPEPEFITPRGEFRIIIPRDVLTESRLKKMGLKERQLKAVKYVKENGKITNKEYQKITGLKKRQSTDDLNLLEEKEIFKRTGKTGKGVCYIIKGAPKGQKGH
jgi:ATP-dependent DNA helicase RecG